MDLPGELTLEQKLRLHAEREFMKTLSEENVRAYLLDLFKQQMLQNNRVKALIKGKG